MFSIIERMIANGDINECNVDRDMEQVWQLGNSTDSHGYQPAARSLVIARIANLDFGLVRSTNGQLLLAMSVAGQHYSTDARRLGTTARDAVESWHLI